MNNLHLIVRDQFPEFIREDYPLFVAFVQAYYKWVKDNSSVNIEQIADLDKTPEQFVQFFRNQLDANGLFNNTNKFNILFLQKIKQIYSAKGSEQALVNVLRLSRQSDVTIKYPNKDILIPSNGRWNQDKFITVERIFGELPSTVSEFSVLYDYNELSIVVNKTEQTDPETTRFYFKNKTKLDLFLGQTISIRNLSGQVIYIGRIVISPARLKIISGGKYWQLGQTIVIPGSDKKTVARVSEIDNNGTITRIEILEYGYDHIQGELISISPYSVKPPISTYNITSELISTSPITYHYTLDLYEYTDGTSDNTQGYLSGININSYFLEDYTELLYTGSLVISTSSSEIPSPPNLESDITMEKWLESRALLRYEFDNSSIIPGYWSDESGQLSNQSVRLQDDYYYQQYSYDIQAEIDAPQYIDIAQSLHPAGNNLFTTYSIIEDLAVIPVAETAFPYIISDRSDVVSITELPRKYVTKLKEDAVTSSEKFTATFSKSLTDDNINSEEFSEFVVSKSVNDTLAISDEVSSFDVSKLLSDSANITDRKLYEFNKTLSDSFNSSDSPAISSDKYLTDSVSVSSDDTSNISVSTYDSEIYFDESYVCVEKTLTIGV